MSKWIPRYMDCSCVLGLLHWRSLVEVPLSVVGSWRSSCQVAWQPFFPGVLLWAILSASSWRHIAQVSSAVWNALCCTHFPDRPPRPECVLSSGILQRHRMRIWLRFPRCFSCSVPFLVWGKCVSLFQILSTLPGHDRFISFPVVFCILRTRYPFSLLWSFAGLGIGLM